MKHETTNFVDAVNTLIENDDIAEIHIFNDIIIDTDHDDAFRVNGIIIANDETSMLHIINVLRERFTRIARCGSASVTTNIIAFRDALHQRCIMINNDDMLSIAFTNDDIDMTMFDGDDE